jgi:AcrR family transcriptional regulator
MFRSLLPPNGPDGYLNALKGQNGGYALRVAQLPQHLSRAPIGRERVSREELASFHRARLLDAALGVFAKRGYQQTTIDNIVVASHSSIGGFYQRFENKEDCFLAVFDRIVSSTRGKIATATEARRSWAEEAYVGLGCLLELFVAEPLAARIILVEAQTAGPAPTARYNQLVDATIEWLRRGRAEHPESAQLPDSFEQAAVSGTAYFLHQRLLSSEQQSVGGLLADTSQLILEPIVGATEVKRLRSGRADPAAIS